MANLFKAFCEGSPLNDGAKAQSVHLFPLGQIKGRDGRNFVLSNPEEVISRFKAGNIDLPIDYEHQVDLPANEKRGPIPAAGWINSLELRDNGIWANVEWTETAAKMIVEKEYRFLSPSFMAVNDTMEIVHLLGAGLVHRPCFELKALANQTEADMDAVPNELGQISEALGLKADATVDDILTAIRTANEVDPEQYVPISAVKDLLKKKNEVAALASLNATRQRVNTAMRDGYLTPAMKDWAISLCSQSPQAFDDFLKTTGPQYAGLFEEYDFSEAQEALEQRRQSADADIDSISAQLGVSPDALT